ncbi:hypothetical protein [Paraburkholderia sp. 35.1]|uniref:hypothetical protein n=1 Tax=Paraburkholderia sp. 35.1 TaxID=2991058 RepID=UPI003D1DF7BB
MFIGVQFNTEMLGNLLRERFKRVPLCVDAQIQVNDNLYVVDHIVIDNQTLFGRGSGFDVAIPVKGAATPTFATTQAISVTQAVTVVLVTEDTLLQTGAAPPDPTALISVPLLVTFDMTFGVSSAGTSVTLTYNTVALVIDDPAVDVSSINAILQANIPAQTSALDILSLLSSLPISGNVVMSGAGITPDSNIIELRIEVGQQPFVASPEYWEYFLDPQLVEGGILKDLTNGDDLAVWMSFWEDGFASLIQQQFENAFQGADSPFQLDTSVDINWQPGANPHIFVNFGGRAMNACDCFWSTQNVNVDVDVTIALTISADDIRYQFDFNYSADPLQTFCCEVSAALLWPYIGAKLLEGGKLDAGEYTGGIFLFFIAAWVIFDISLGLASSYQPSIPLSKLSGNCSQTGAQTIVCLLPFPTDTVARTCDAPLIQHQVPTQIYGIEADTVPAPDDGIQTYIPIFPDGALVIAGTNTIQATIPCTLVCTVNQFDWRFPTPTCGTLLGSITMSASVVLSGKGDIPLWLCKVNAIGVTADAYAPYITVSYSYCPMLITIAVDVPADALPAGPCELLVQTTAGARIVTLAPIAVVTSEQIQEFNDGVKRWRLDHCFTALDNWYRFFRNFNLAWLVDPAPEQVDSERESHLWNVILGGATSGDLLALIGPDGQTLSQGLVDANGVVELSALLYPSSAAPRYELSLRRVRTAAEPSSAGGTAIKMMVKQILLVEQSTLLEGRNPMAAVIEQRRGARTLSVAMPGGISIFNISNAATPKLIKQCICTVRGAQRDAFNRLLTWDDAGIIVWQAHTPRRVFEVEGVRDVQVLPSGGYLIETRHETICVDASWQAVGLDSAKTNDLVKAGFDTRSRFGLIANIEAGRVSLKSIQGTRTL